MTDLCGKTPARYTVIPPGVDLEVFKPHGRAASRRRLGIDTAERTLSLYDEVASVSRSRSARRYAIS